LSSPDRVDAPAPVSRRERKKLETRDRIVECAVALFASQGYDATTMEDIGECADVSRATVFNYFARKVDIVTEVFTRRRARLAELIVEAGEKTSDTPGRLRHALGGMARLYDDDPSTGRAVVRAWLRAGGPLLPDASDSAALFADVIRSGQQHGDVPPDLDATRAGVVILDAYLGVLFRWVSDEDGRFALEENLTATLDLVLTGMAR
jgi:TetR/AcrR family transcriptional regulator, cholesterol catabolism regulator